MNATVNNWKNIFAQSNYKKALENYDPRILMRNRQYKTNAGDVREISVNNILYYNLRCEFIKKIGFSDFSLHEFITVEGETIPDSEKFDYKNFYCYIHTSFSVCWEPKIQYTFLGERFSFSVNSNETISNEFVKKQVLKHLNKYNLFAPGLFRDLQNIIQDSKQKTILYYKRHISKSWRKETDRAEEVYNYIFKKYNLEISLDAFKNENAAYRYALDFIKKYGKPEKPKYVAKFRPLEFLCDFDGDIDEAEELLNLHLSENEHLIYV